MSSPARLPLVVEVLCTADDAYGVAIAAHTLAVAGRKDDALAMLAFLAEAGAAARPLLRGVLTAERQAAEMRDAAERTANTIGLVLRRPAQEHLHAANDESHSASNPTEPAA